MAETPYEKKRTELMNRQYEERQNTLSDHKLSNEAFGKDGPPEHIKQAQRNELNRLNLKHNKQTKEFRAQNRAKTAKELQKENPKTDKAKVQSKEKDADKKKGKQSENKGKGKDSNKGKGMDK